MNIIAKSYKSLKNSKRAILQLTVKKLFSTDYQQDLKLKTVKKVVKKKFRLSAKKLFLTYPKCNLRPKNVLDQLSKILENYKIETYVISIEEHLEVSEDFEKGKHIHCYLELDRKFDTQNAIFLDLITATQNKDTKVFHGNYQGVKNKSKVITYVLKDVMNFDNENQVIISDNLSLYMKNNSSILMDWKDSMIYLGEQGRIEDAMGLLKANSSMQYLKSHESIERSLRSLRIKELGFEIKFSLDKFNIPDNLKESLDNAYTNQLTHVLEGESDTKKTKFLEAYIVQNLKLEPLIVNNIDSIRFFKPEKHNCIFFDDCSFKKLDREKLIKLFDVESSTTFNIKHGSIQIPKNVPRFIVTNKPLKYYIGSLINDKAISRRLKIYSLGKLSLIRL